MRKFKIITLLITIVVLFGWLFMVLTENSRVRKWGGSMELELDSGQKLVNVTWKDDDVWVLTRPIREGERIETEPYIFQEKSKRGMLEGKIKIYERAED